MSNKTIIDLYEYEIYGYSSSLMNDIPFFNKIETVDESDCGLIQTGDKKSTPVFNKNFKSSCDIISSKPFSDNSTRHNVNHGNIYDDVYYNTKAKSSMQLDYCYKDMDDVFETLKIGLNITKNYLIKRLIRNSITDENIPKSINDINIDDALIFNLKLDSNSKIIIFGDFHGSFHTFWRHMYRLVQSKILLDGYKLKDGYKILFLGDIFDRGQHALEILLFIMNLIKINNNAGGNYRVIYNRGNHESPELYQLNNLSLKSEILDKGISNIHYNQIMDILKEFFALSPSAVILHCPNNQKLWLSHGGFPLNSIQNGPINIKKYLNTSTVFYFKKMSYIPTQIRWNDFYSLKYSMFNITRGGRTSVPIYNIGTDDISKFCDINGIDFIIRGHQDFPFNSYIVSKSDNDPSYSKFTPGKKENDNIKDNDYIFMNEFYDYKHNKNGRNAVYGPISRISLSKEVKNIELNEHNIELYPVLTLSTNTDNNRPLVHDSFALLRFDLKTNNLPLKKSNIIGGNKYYHKYIKYKSKYIQLCDLHS